MARPSSLCWLQRHRMIYHFRSAGLASKNRRDFYVYISNFLDFVPPQNSNHRLETTVHSQEKPRAHKNKIGFALANVQMALGQTAGCPRVNWAKKFMCSPRNTRNISFSFWLTGGLSQGCPDFQKVYVFKVYVPFSALDETQKCVKCIWSKKCGVTGRPRWTPNGVYRTAAGGG